MKSYSECWIYNKNTNKHKHSPINGNTVNKGSIKLENSKMYEEASLPGKGCGVVASRDIYPGQSCYEYYSI